MHTEKVSTSTSTSSNENRKSSKPIMEKRRRARMNASLAELKALLLEFMKKEGNRHSKMEKADILEMTVKQLRHLQRQNFSASANEDTSLLTKYVLGFQECASEVSRYLSSMSEVEPDIRTRLLNHLATYITSSPSFSNSSSPKRHSSSPPSPCLSTKATGNRPLSESEVSSSPSPDRVATSSSNSPPPLSTSSQSRQILLTKVPASCQLECPTSNEATSSDSKQVASSTIANVTGLTNGILTLDPSLSHIQASKVGAGGGLQLLATKMPTCQVAFVLPASVMTDDSLHALQGQQNYFPVPIYAPTSQTTLAPLTGSTGSSTGAMMTLLPEMTKSNIGVAPLSNMATLPQIISFPGALPSSGPQILLNGTEIYKEFETPSKHNALISTPEMKKSLSPPVSIGKELSRNHHQRHQHPYHHIRGDRDTPALRINEDENVWRPW